MRSFAVGLRSATSRRFAGLSVVAIPLGVLC